MIGARWFPHGSAWHVLTEHDPTASECGISLLAPPQRTVASTEEDPVPPNPCRRCFVELGLRDVEDEPLDEALARGYEVFDPSDDEG